MGYRLNLMVFTLIYCWSSAKIKANENAPYNIEITAAHPHPDNNKEYCTFDSLRLTKIGRNAFSLSGSLTMLKNLGNQEHASFSLYQKSALTGKFSSTPIMSKTETVCGYMTSDTQFYPDIVKVSNFPEPGVCPFPKGTYTVNNFVIDSEKLPKVILPGDYRLLVQVFKQKMLIGYEAFLTISKVL